MRASYYAYKCDCSSCSAFSLASSTRQALYSAFRHKYSSSDFSLDYSTIHASFSAFSPTICSSSDPPLASRARRTPSCTFSCVRSCSSTFSLASLASQASSSAFSRNTPYFSSDFSLASSTSCASSSASICECSSDICLASRVRGTLSSSSTVSAYAPLVYALILWQVVPLCHPSADPDLLPLI